MIHLATFLMCDLKNFTLKNNLTDEDTLLTVQITKKGLQQFIDSNIQFMNGYLNSIVIPDISLEVALFTVVLKDIRVKEIILPKTTINLEQNKLFGSLTQAQLHFSFQFSVTQNAYPYLEDGGDGSLDINAGGFFEADEPSTDENCLYHVQARLLSGKLVIEQLKVKLDGKLAFIYDALMEVLTQIMVETFNTKINDLIFEQIVEVLNRVMRDMSLGIWSENSNFFADDRFISLKLDEQFLVAAMPGQVHFIENNVATTWLPTLQAPRKRVLSNYPMQYFVQKEAFQSSLNAYRRHSPQFQNVEMKVQNFVRQGLVVDVKSPNFTATMLFGVRQTFENRGSASNDTWFRLQFKTIVRCVGSCDGAVEMGKMVTEYQKKSVVGIHTSNSMEEARCIGIYVNEDYWHSGCELLTRV